MFPLMTSSEVVNPTEGPHTQHALPSAGAHEPPLQTPFAVEESSFDYATATTCVDDMTFGSTVAGSAILNVPAQLSGDGVVSGNNISNGVNDIYGTQECDGFILEELSRFLNDSPLGNTTFGEV